MGNKYKFKDTARYNVISMRVSDVERIELHHIASYQELSISEVMRQAINSYTRDHKPIVDGYRNFGGGKYEEH